ncbi:MAG TPA: hypothetical protein VHL78_10625 [Actinomycetota bacterium]|nr:hypothetical protein [Actinomycetota bacterium]
MIKRTFLVVYDYGQGGVWAFVRARSSDDIRRRFPELEVVQSPPGWMTPEDEDRIRRTMTFDVDDPSGLLEHVAAGRQDFRGDEAGGAPRSRRRPGATA